DGIEGSGPERQTHVLSQETQIRALAGPRELQTFGRQVDPRDVEAETCQASGVPSVAAPQVEHAGPGNQQVVLDEAVDETRRFVVVAVRVELVIVGRVKPGCEPFRPAKAGRYMVSWSQVIGQSFRYCRLHICSLLEA